MFKFVIKLGFFKMDVFMEDEINKKDVCDEEEMFINENQEDVDVVEYMEEIREKNMEEIREKNIRNVNEKYGNMDFIDFGMWKRIEKGDRDFLVEKGFLVRLLINYYFLRDKFNRCFFYLFYIRKMSNGENYDRRWLVYLKFKDFFFLLVL